MITWYWVNDDFGNLLFVTEIQWPNPKYFTRIVVKQ